MKNGETRRGNTKVEDILMTIGKTGDLARHIMHINDNKWKTQVGMAAKDL